MMSWLLRADNEPKTTCAASSLRLPRYGGHATFGRPGGSKASQTELVYVHGLTHYVEVVSNTS